MAPVSWTDKADRFAEATLAVNNQITMAKTADLGRRVRNSVAKYTRALRAGGGDKAQRSQHGDIEEKALRYLGECGLMPMLGSISEGQIPPAPDDLSFLHRLVKEKQPQIILEFGVGFSTLVMAHALASLSPMGKKRRRKVYALDTSEQWLENLRQRIPEDLADYIELSHSSASVALVDHELCHFYDELPDIQPDLIYLDGPDARDVRGSYRGLTFRQDGRRPRPPVAADILLYESTLAHGSIVVVDGRAHNVLFLERRLKRKWTRETNQAAHRTVFRLVG